jgi:hypothetical protein
MEDDEICFPGEGEDGRILASVPPPTLELILSPTTTTTTASLLASDNSLICSGYTSDLTACTRKRQRLTD